MRSLRHLTIILVTVPAMLCGAGAVAANDVTPLFESDDILDVTITAPMREIMRERFYNEDKPGQITYTDPEAGEQTLDVGVRTRGRFRRQAKVCTFAPLRLNFKKSATKNTLFQGTNKLKLVTHCRNKKNENLQAMLREYLAYRIFNLVTDYSFRVRLLRVTYIDSDTNNEFSSSYAFLIEHREQVAKRIGVGVNGAEQTEVRYIDGPFTNLGALFQYLIGNTDFSPIRAAEGERCCHNNVLFGETEGEILSIPYDFDMSGLANAPYAVPNPRFRLRSVEDRLYRGRCQNNQHLEASVQAFQDKKEDIYALLTADYFDRRSNRHLTRFIGEFYETLDDPKKFDRNIRSRCLN